MVLPIRVPQLTEAMGQTPIVYLQAVLDRQLADKAYAYRLMGMLMGESAKATRQTQNEVALAANLGWDRFTPLSFLFTASRAQDYWETVRIGLDTKKSVLVFLDEEVILNDNRDETFTGTIVSVGDPDKLVLFSSTVRLTRRGKVEMGELTLLADEEISEQMEKNFRQLIAGMFGLYLGKDAANFFD